MQTPLACERAPMAKTWQPASRNSATLASRGVSLAFLLLALHSSTVAAGGQLTAAATGTESGISHVTAERFPVRSGFKLVAVGILQLYGPDVVVNRTSAEIAFITAVNTQLISYLTLRMVNYTAHPLHTPGLERYAALIEKVELYQSMESTLNFKNILDAQALNSALQIFGVVMTQNGAAANILGNFLQNLQPWNAVTTTPPAITYILSHIELTGTNMLPFHHEKQTLLLDTLLKIFIADGIPVALLNVSSWMEAEGSVSSRRRLLHNKTDTVLLDIWTTLLPAGSVTAQAVWADVASPDTRVWAITEQWGVPMNITFRNATSYANVYTDGSSESTFNVTVVSVASAAAINPPASSSSMGPGALAGITVAAILALLAVAGLAVLLWRRIQRLEPADQPSTELTAIDLRWSMSPDEIVICTRPDGSLWLLGEGNFGTVYKAMRSGTTEVAVKMVTRPVDGTALRVVQQGIADLQQIRRHANVVQFYGACLTDTAIMLCIEYMEGGDLRRALSEERHVGTHHYVWYSNGKHVALHVARGLLFLHSSGVIHQDVKSSNVLLTRDGAAKVAYLGLSKMGGLLEDSSTSVDPVGTFNYVAPELLMAARCTSRVDVFSYGVLLWELVTHELPQRGHMRDVLVPEECPAEVGALIRGCLDFDPASRPTMRDVVERLQRIV